MRLPSSRFPFFVLHFAKTVYAFFRLSEPDGWRSWERSSCSGSLFKTMFPEIAV